MLFIARSGAGRLGPHVTTEAASKTDAKAAAEAQRAASAEEVRNHTLLSVGSYMIHCLPVPGIQGDGVTNEPYHHESTHFYTIDLQSGESS